MPNSIFHIFSLFMKLSPSRPRVKQGQGQVIIICEYGKNKCCTEIINQTIAYSGWVNKAMKAMEQIM